MISCVMENVEVIKRFLFVKNNDSKQLLFLDFVLFSRIRVLTGFEFSLWIPNYRFDYQ